LALRVADVEDEKQIITKHYLKLIDIENVI